MDKREKELRNEYKDISKKFQEFEKEIYDSRHISGSDQDEIWELLGKVREMVTRIYREKLAIFSESEL